MARASVTPLPLTTGVLAAADLTTLNAILGHMPTVPYWGYNGSARRYWDFIYGASAGDRGTR